MKFHMAINTSFVKYFNFSDRAPRSEFWYFSLFVLLGSGFAIVIDIFILGKMGIGGGRATILFDLMIFLPHLSVTARRLHDVNKSGWWLVLILLYYLAIFAIYFVLTLRDYEIPKFVNWLSYFNNELGLVPILYWLLKRGDEGSNRFGPNPMRPQAEAQLSSVIHFHTAIKTGFVKCFNFSGRASRSEFWYFWLFIIFGQAITRAVDLTVLNIAGSDVGLARALFSLTSVTPLISVTVRRLHDVNRSGAWILLPLVPVVVLFLSYHLSVLFNFTPHGFIEVALMVFLLLCIGLLLFWLVKKTEAGSNRFGHNPLTGAAYSQSFSSTN